MLYDLCKQNDFIYIDNDNITSEYLFAGDGLHLTDDGTRLLKQNFMQAIYWLTVLGVVTTQASTLDNSNHGHSVNNGGVLNNSGPTACNCFDANSSGSQDELTQSSEENSSLLRKIRVKNVGRLIIASLNINSIANKSDRLEEFVEENVDVLIILETKIDNTFPTAQFRINGFSEPFRKDRDRNGGGCS